MGLFKSAQKTEMAKSILGIQQFYHNATIKNHKLNEHKILLYKYIKWPEHYPSTTVEKQAVMAEVPLAIKKQIKAFTLARKSLVSAYGLIAKNASFKDEPQLYIQLVKLTESMIQETDREVARLIPLFEEERTLLQSNEFRDFANANLNDVATREKYLSFITIFDQERGVYKSLTAVIAGRYHEYLEMEKAVKQYVENLSPLNDTITLFAGLGIVIGAIAGIVTTIVMFFSNAVNPSFNYTFNDFLGDISLKYTLIVVGSGVAGGVASGVLGTLVKTTGSFIESAARKANEVHIAFD